MDNPAARSLMETVQKLNRIGKLAGANKPEVDDYLRGIDSDPLSDWFTELLREKDQELAGQRQQSDRLAVALRDWYAAKAARTAVEPPGEAELRLAQVLHEMKIVEP
jgi:hypothetical protein